MSNRFQEAIRKNELVKFANGDDQYFRSDPESGLHWVLQSWKQDIIPALIVDENTVDNSYVCSMINQLIADSNTPINNRLNVLLYHVYVHYYLLSERRIDHDYLRNCEPAIIQFIRTSIDQVDPKINPDVTGAITRIRERGGLVSYQL